MMILTETASSVATSAQITAVLDVLKSIAEYILNMVGSVVTLVMSQPLLLIPIGVVMLRTVISVFRTLF